MRRIEGGGRRYLLAGGRVIATPGYDARAAILGTATHFGRWVDSVSDGAAVRFLAQRFAGRVSLSGRLWKCVAAMAIAREEQAASAITSRPTLERLMRCDNPTSSDGRNKTAQAAGPPLYRGILPPATYSD